MVDLAMDPHFSSDGSSSPPDTIDVHTPAPKRSAAEAGLKPNGSRPAKSVKRRASKACQCCRARKVRCNVVEHGPPCTNCRLDEVECIVSESKRKKKWTATGLDQQSPQSSKGDASYKPATFHVSAQPPYGPSKRPGEHVPHALYQDLSKDAAPVLHTQSKPSLYTPQLMANLQRMGPRSDTSDPAPLMTTLLSPVTPSYSLPLYIKPLPSKLHMEDILFLQKRGALSIPATPLRDELLKNFVEFVYPYMPLLDVHEIVACIDRSDGSSCISLLLFQAIMFSAVATVDIRHLKAAGYGTRRDARRDFFQRTRLLYDFDIEIDRVSLIQSLLLMTYWYETPDDQKDSHHWMGIAVSLSHTIGLHRNPEKSHGMSVAQKKLWKRIWWSTYIRDRLVALGMRRPTRIKDADFDVPMLSLDDFESAVLPDAPSCIPAECKIMRDLDKQRQLAVMCIEKAKLCVCMSHVLSVQYSVLNNTQGVMDEEGSSRTTVRLTVKKSGPDSEDVRTCDEELERWRENLPSEAEYREPTWHDVDAGNESLVLSRSLLHMIYYATSSALHRPQVLPSATPQRPMQWETIERSRKAVRLASGETTRMAYTLFNLDMVRYLPTAGTTVLLPAIIIHLLDIKAPDEATRRIALQGFCQCMQIMGKLRDIYAAADYSTAFLEAAIRKAEITLPPRSDEGKEPRAVITSAQGLVEAGRRMQLVPPAAPETSALTPPPEDPRSRPDMDALTDADIAKQLNSYLATTPPDSEHQNLMEGLEADDVSGMQADVELDFDSLINLDAAGDGWPLEDGGFTDASGENAGFAMDMGWMKGMTEDGISAAGR